MKLNDLYPSRYLKAADAEDQDLVLTIAGVEMRDLGDQEKPVITFSDEDRELVLNKTNANTVAKLYGNDTDAWIGKRIALYATEVQFQNQMVPSLRVRSKPPRATNRPASDVVNEPMPF